MSAFRCPECGLVGLEVIDSRANSAGTRIRRRHRCLTCASRFTSYELLTAGAGEAPERIMARQIATRLRTLAASLEQ